MSAFRPYQAPPPFPPPPPYYYMPPPPPFYFPPPPPPYFFPPPPPPMPYVPFSHTVSYPPATTISPMPPPPQPPLPPSLPPSSSSSSSSTDSVRRTPATSDKIYRYLEETYPDPNEIEGETVRTFYEKFLEETLYETSYNTFREAFRAYSEKPPLKTNKKKRPAEEKKASKPKHVKQEPPNETSSSSLPPKRVRKPTNIEQPVVALVKELYPHHSPKELARVSLEEIYRKVLQEGYTLKEEALEPLLIEHNLLPKKEKNSSSSPSSSSSSTSSLSPLVFEKRFNIQTQRAYTSQLHLCPHCKEDYEKLWDPTRHEPTKSSQKKFRACLNEMNDTAEDSYSQKVEIVYLNPKKGNGVKSLASIARGEVVGQYTGRVVREDEVKNTDYLMAQASTEFDKWKIDATALGNWTAFINHRSHQNANLEMVTVLLDGFPRVFLVAIKDISVGEELSYDYGKDYWKNKGIEPIDE